MWRLGLVAAALALAGCGRGHPVEPRDASADRAADARADGSTDAGRDAEPSACPLPPGLARGADEGHADPLGAGPGQARAGRLEASELPAWPSGLETWEAGDVALANDRIALVIEDAGPSDLYDPWGGKPVGLARVEDGALVEPADFGELLMLTGRMGLVVRKVGIIADGTVGAGQAIVRASGRLAPLPFFQSIVEGLLPGGYGDIPAAIEYVLEPGADHVDIYWIYASPRGRRARVPQTLHGFMFTPRMPAYAPGLGFATDGSDLPYIAFVDDDATSFAYSRPGDEMLRAGISVAGFKSGFTGAFTIDACSRTRVHHARLTIGGPGLDGLRLAVARTEVEPMRRLSGTVRDASGDPAEGVRVHAVTPGGDYLTRARTDADGRYELHVPADADIELHAWRRGDRAVGPVTVPFGDSRDLALDPGGWVRVTATDADTGGPLPVRVQMRPTGGAAVPRVPAHFGEPPVTAGRLHVAYPSDGETRLRVPEGRWRVIVSRGYEYELYSEVVDVGEGEQAMVEAPLERVVDTTGVLCGDFHIHTHRSNDSGDDARLKLRSAAADGLEVPVRSDHEFVDPWQSMVAELGLERWIAGLSSVELTTFQSYGHFGAVPVEVSDGVNNGTPLWQRYPSAAAPGVELETLQAPELFANVRSRPEEPAIIINHPRGNTNYFGAAGYDPVTGTVERPEMWDESFHLVEVFNDDDWHDVLDTVVTDWLSFLDSGRRVFAVGSSDSHGIVGSPVGYPRTCMAVGTDDPREIDGATARDTLLQGHHTVSGGIYVDTSVGGAGPGDEATGVGETAMVNVRIQAASWIDVDAFDVVVDGEIVETVDILPGDADPMNPVIRFEEDVQVDVAPSGSYVIVAAYGDEALEPVHPGRDPFGVTNPVFLSR